MDWSIDSNKFVYIYKHYNSINLSQASHLIHLIYIQISPK